MEQRKQGRGWHGHFLGFRARLDCESIPVIPAWVVRNNLDDPSPRAINERLGYYAGGGKLYD